MNSWQVRVFCGALLGGVALLSPSLLSAQTQDSIIRLDPVIVNAERFGTPLSESVSAVSVLTSDELNRVPNATLADAFRQIPGFALVDQDGFGRDPQLISRGFYGGGEAEYVVVLLDGRPLNEVQTGLIRWDAIPLASVERVEVLHGGSSALWGDAAIGGVVNIVTRGMGGAPVVGWETAAGSNATWRGAIDASGTLGERSWSLYGGMDRTEGFREHAERTAGRIGGEMELGTVGSGMLSFSAGADWRDYDDPGALIEGAVEDDPSRSSAHHRFDKTHDQGLQGDLRWERPVGTNATFAATLFGEKRETDATRTLVLAPVFFADTKDRVLESSRLGASAQLAIGADPLEIGGRLLIGAEFSNSGLDTRYYQVAMGSEEDYLNATGARGDLDASGEGDRRSLSAFAHYQLSPVERLRFSVGVRGDWINDSFQPTGGSAVDSDHSAVSPRIGVNVGYLEGASQNGNLYVSFGRSFKAPTLDQLFDQRSIPTDFPPYSITTSNSELVPQRGKSIEAGIYHGVIFGSGRVGAHFSLSAYRMDMEDELDFNVETFRYVNIGESRHDGIEAGLRIQEAVRGGSVFLNYTLQDATYMNGGNVGNRLKAIPRHSLSAGANTSLFAGLEGGVVATRQSGIYLDDANTVELPAYTRVDGRLSYPIGGLTLNVDVRNLLDADYSTTGFPEPSGSGAMFYRPAAGRTFEIGVRGVR